MGLIGVGTNLGDRSQAIEFAMRQLRAHEGIENLIASRNYETKPIGGPSGQRGFINAAFVLESSLPADELLAALQQIEKVAGRVRHERWAPRTLDLDLLLYGDAVIERLDLIVPHPRLSFRRFVLEPAAEIAPQMVHPTTGLQICELYRALDCGIDYVAIAGGTLEQRQRLVRDVVSQATGIRVLTAQSPNRAEDDSSSPALQVSIEFLDHQLACLESMNASPKRCANFVKQNDNSWLSDFWLGSTFVATKSQLAEQDFIKYKKYWQRCTKDTLIEPKLGVMLDTTPALAEIARTLKQPVLKLNSADEAWNRHEVLAAIEAMM